MFDLDPLTLKINSIISTNMDQSTKINVFNLIIKIEYIKFFSLSLFTKYTVHTNEDIIISLIKIT